ncbi:hypothetical protein [Methanofollis fontis]|nr:hypothetical protein [Methanofollis fontis]
MGKITGDGLDARKLLGGEEDLRGLLARHADDLPPAEALLYRLKKFDPTI